MRGNDKIIILDDQIMYRRNGQVELKRLPGVAVVYREINPEFGAGKEQAFFDRIFTDRSHVRAVGNTVVDSCPILSEIARR